MSHRMGVLGTGGLGMMLGRQIRRQPDARLVALADVSTGSRSQAGKELGVPPEARYDDLDDLLKEMNLDAIAIATPHSLHYKQVVTAVDQGVHVLCEKPLVTDLEHARDLVAHAEQADEVLMVGYQRHLEPEYQYARRRWADDDADPTFISAEITEDWLTGNIGTWRVEPSLSGGGFLADTGDHIVDAVLWTTGQTPTTVTADMDFYDSDVDTRANLTVEFKEGLTAHLSFQADVSRVTERLQGWDTDGGVRIEGREWGDRSLTVIKADGSEFNPYIEVRDSAYVDSQTKLDRFVDAIEGTHPSPATPRDALRTLAVSEAAYRSAKTGEPVTVDIQQ